VYDAGDSPKETARAIANDEVQCVIPTYDADDPSPPVAPSANHTMEQGTGNLTLVPIDWHDEGRVGQWEFLTSFVSTSSAKVLGRFKALLKPVVMSGCVQLVHTLGAAALTEPHEQALPTLVRGSAVPGLVHTKFEISYNGTDFAESVCEVTASYIDQALRYSSVQTLYAFSFVAPIGVQVLAWRFSVNSDVSQAGRWEIVSRVNFAVFEMALATAIITSVTYSPEDAVEPLPLSIG